MTDPQTPFSAWRARMGQKTNRGRPISRIEGARLLGFTSPNHATKLDQADDLPVHVALACAALEAGLEPIK